MMLRTNFSVVMTTDKLTEMLPILYHLFGHRSRLTQKLLPLLERPTEGRPINRATMPDPLREALDEDQELHELIRKLDWCDDIFFQQASVLAESQLSALHEQIQGIV